MSTTLRQPRRFTRNAHVRFAKNRKDALFSQVGGSPTPAQEVLISRAISLEWRLREVDRRLRVNGDSMSIETMRGLMATANATEQQLRLTLCALGLQQGAPVDRSVGELLAAVAQGASGTVIDEATAPAELEDAR